MPKISNPCRALVAAGLVALFVSACGTTPAPNFRGRWQPLNHFDESPRALPLAQAYIYAPSPLDRTLKNMLTRWARDSRMTLSYLHGADYTLYEPVAGISTASLEQAISELNAAYGGQGIMITTDGRQIVVRGAQAEHDAAPAAP